MSEHPRERDVEQKIKQATEGMPKEAYKGLLLLKKKNAIIIADYLIAYKRERDVKDSTRFNHYCYLMRFARKMNKPFAQVTSEDISTYMDGFEKSEVEDPSHKWKGAYNLFWQIITSFFKWFYDPKSPPSERPKPDVLPHIQKKKHNFKNDEIYKPSDMWTLEEHEIFLKHCPDPRIKCYHAIAASTGGRPDEILSAKIEDIDWPSDGGFPTITLRGKTSKRDVTIYYFIQYLKEWIALHPKRAVPSSYLIYSKKTQGMLREDSLRGIYERDLHTHFTELLDEAIGQDDRKHIEQLLQKPWNPYVIRHSTITYFTKEVLLPDPTHMNQHFGWAKDSMMSARYQHLAGGESNKYLGEKLGLVDSRSKQPKLPKLLECPIVTCRESNNPDTPFCIKCGYPLTVAGHMKKRNREEEAEKQRHQEIEFLKDQIQMLAQESFFER